MPSYQKRDSGLWSVRFTVGTKQKRLSGFTTKKEAQWAYEDFIAENGKHDQPQEQVKIRIAFSLILNKYLQQQEKNVKKITYYCGLKKIEKHIEPYFNGYDMSDISTLMLQEWIQSLQGSYNQKKSVISLMSSILTFGAKYYGTENNMRLVDKPRKTEIKKELHILDEQQFQSFINCCDEEYKCFFTFLFLTGCRKGEAVAIQVQDIDIKSKKVHISKNVSKLGEITSPKTIQSDRYVLLPDTLCKMFQDRCKNMEASDFVFSLKKNPYSFSQLTRVANNACKRAKMEPVRIHDFRHSFATMMLKRLPAHIVSRMLGHSTVTQTLNTYSHYIKSDDSMVMDALNGINA